MGIEEKCRQRANDIVKALEEKAGIRWGNSNHYVLLRDLSLPSQPPIRDSLNIYPRENALYGLVKAILGDVDEAGHIFSEVAAPRNQSGTLLDLSHIPTKEAFVEAIKIPELLFYTGKDSKTPLTFLSTDNYRLAEATRDYGSLTHLFTMLAFVRHSFGFPPLNFSSSLGDLHSEDARGSYLAVGLTRMLNWTSPLLLDLYSPYPEIQETHTKFNVGTNALLAIALALSGNQHDAKYHLSALDTCYAREGEPFSKNKSGLYRSRFDIWSEPMGESGSGFDTFLACLAWAMVGHSSEAEKILQLVDSVYPTERALESVIHPSKTAWDDEMSRWKGFSQSALYSEDVKSTASYALLAHFMGKKHAAFERLEGLSRNWRAELGEGDGWTAMDALFTQQPNERERMKFTEPYLWAAFAYADLSRDKSYFKPDVQHVPAIFTQEPQRQQGQKLLH